MARKHDRAAASLRPVEMSPGFQRTAEGSVLYRAGGTVVLCTASIDPGVPAWMTGRGVGWLTAEYQMHPRSSPARREARDGRGKAPSGRTQEIQRLIGRALRAAIDLEKVGERTITIDCDVLEADGGTRTASITGGFVALALGVAKLVDRGEIQPALREEVAAVSVGKRGDELLLDLDYSEDSKADVDMNVVATSTGALIEVQATAERGTMHRAEHDGLLDLALSGIRSLVALQRGALASANVAWEKLRVPSS